MVENVEKKKVHSCSCVLWTVRGLFWSYWIFLTVLLLVYNPFAIVPVDEELVEQGFGIHLDAHVAAFIVLGVLGLASRYGRSWKIALGLVIYGGLTEYLQGFTGRCPDWCDTLNNGLGILYAWGGWSLVQWFPGRGAFRKKGEEEKKSDER